MSEYIAIINPTSPANTCIAAILFRHGLLVGSIANLAMLNDQIERYGPPKVLIYNDSDGDSEDLSIVNKLRTAGTTSIVAIVEPTSNLVADEKHWLDADDVVILPTTEVELVLRVRRLLNAKCDLRKLPNEPQPINRSVQSPARYPEWLGDYSDIHDLQVNLSAQERKLLGALLEAQGRVVPVAQLAARLGVAEFDSPVNSVRVQVSRLRKKLNTVPNLPYRIMTNRGMGYHLTRSC